MSERKKRHVMGELAAPDKYIPMPRPDPRVEIPAERTLAAAQAEYRARLAEIYPMGQLSIDAGVPDIVHAPTGAPETFKGVSQAQEDAATTAMLQHVTGVANPDRFHEMQQTWPESENVEYAPEASYYTRAKAMLPRGWFGD